MFMKKIVITEISPDDIDVVCEIAVKAWEGIHAGYRKYIGDDDLYERTSVNWREKKMLSIREKAEKEPEHVLVAKDETGTIMGFITLEKVDTDTGIGEIGNNAVSPEYRGNGVGSSLYQKALDIFRKNGLVYAVVSTGYEDEGHAAARAAYQKAGFKKMKTSVTYSMKL